MTDFDNCSCHERPIKCPACCLASWSGHQCDGPPERCDLTAATRRNDTARNPDTHAETEGASA